MLVLSLSCCLQRCGFLLCFSVAQRENASSHLRFRERSRTVGLQFPTRSYFLS